MQFEEIIEINNKRRGVAPPTKDKLKKKALRFSLLNARKKGVIFNPDGLLGMAESSKTKYGDYFQIGQLANNKNNKINLLKNELNMLNEDNNLSR